MANVQRYLWADGVAWMTPASASIIEVGDFVALSSDELIPISEVADAGEAADNREAGADGCVGIAAEASAAGETRPIKVQYKGVFRLTQQTAAAIDMGDPVGIYADATSCSDQLVVEDSTSPIGYCVQNKDSTSDVSIKVCLQLSKWQTLNG